MCPDKSNCVELQKELNFNTVVYTVDTNHEPESEDDAKFITMPLSKCLLQYRPSKVVIS